MHHCYIVGHKALRAIALARLMRPLGWRSPAAATGGPNFHAIARQDLDADFLGAQDARRAPRGDKTIVMRRSIFAAQETAGAMPGTVTRRVGDRRLDRFEHQVERDAETAAKLTVPARIGAKLVMAEMQGKPHFISEQLYIDKRGPYLAIVGL